MNRVVEVDDENFVAVVEPGVRLDELDAELADRGLVYPVFPGEYSASLGGNVATNAGGMRAVKYGVTRQNVLGLQAALPTGELITPAARSSKVSSGYDLTQLRHRVGGHARPRDQGHAAPLPPPTHTATLLAPFATLDEVTAAVPRIVASGVGRSSSSTSTCSRWPAATAYVGPRPRHPGRREVRRPRLPGRRPGEHPRRPARRRHRGHRHPAATNSGPSTPTCCRARRRRPHRRPREGVLGGQGERRERHRRRGRAPGLDPRVHGPGGRVGGRARGVRGRAAGTRATATSTSACSSPTPRPAAGCSAACSPPAWRSAGRSRASTASGGPSRRTSSALEDPAKLALLRRIKAAFDPHGILNPGLVAS